MYTFNIFELVTLESWILVHPVNNAESVKPKRSVPEKKTISSSARQRNNAPQNKRKNSATKQTKPLSKAKPNEADQEVESSLSKKFIRTCFWF